MKTEFSDRTFSNKVRRAATVCALLLMMGCQASATVRPVIAAGSAEPPVAADIKQRPRWYRTCCYNANTVETHRGKVVRIDRILTGRNGDGIHIVLDMGDEQFQIKDAIGNEMAEECNGKAKQL